MSNQQKSGAKPDGPGHHLRLVMGLVALVLLPVACTGPEAVAPTLEPQPQALVWPSPPDQPRFAYAGTLSGERNFLAEGDDGESGLESALKWVAGLVIGEPDFLELQRPVSGMTDSSGRILVVDASHKSVFVFDIPERRLERWQLAGPGLGFLSPVAIAGDLRSGFFVTDSELGEVFHLDGEGKPVGRFGKGILKRPTGIARDAARELIYVADTASHDIKVFNAQGAMIDTLGVRGSEEGRFNAPTHLAFRGGELYVADTLNFRIQVFDVDGDGRLSFGRLGLFVGNMTRPKGVAIDSKGQIYVVESYFDHLLVHNNQGELLLAIGGTGPEVGQFYLPSGVWTDGLGRVFVADMFNGRVIVLKDLSLG